MNYNENLWQKARRKFEQIVSSLPEKIIVEDETIKFIDRLITSGEKGNAVETQQVFLDSIVSDSSIIFSLVRNDLYNPINWKYILTKEGSRVVFIANTCFKDIVIFDKLKSEIIKSYERKEIDRLIGHAITKYSLIGRPMEQLNMDSGGIITRTPVVDNNALKDLFEQFSPDKEGATYHYSLRHL